MNEKMRKISRIKGLFRIVRERKKIFSGIYILVAILFPVIGLLIDIFVIKTSAESRIIGLYIVIVSVLLFLTYWITYRIVDALRVEKIALDIINLYFDSIRNVYRENIREFNLIERDIESGLRV